MNWGRPEIFNSDQGAQFTSEAFTQMLQEQGVRVSMDGKGRYLDNIFVERLWRSIKYEEVYLKAYQTVARGPNWDQCLPGVLQPAEAITRLWATGQAAYSRCTKMANEGKTLAIPD